MTSTANTPKRSRETRASPPSTSRTHPQLKFLTADSARTRPLKRTGLSRPTAAVSPFQP